MKLGREKNPSHRVRKFVARRNVQSRLKRVSPGRLVKCSRIIVGDHRARDEFPRSLPSPT